MSYERFQTVSNFRASPRCFCREANGIKMSQTVSFSSGFAQANVIKRFQTVSIFPGFAQVFLQAGKCLKTFLSCLGIGAFLQATVSQHCYYVSTLTRQKYRQMSHEIVATDIHRAIAEWVDFCNFDRSFEKLEREILN